MQMFKLKVYHGGDRVSIEETLAPTPQDAIAAYAAMDQKAEILEVLPSQQPDMPKVSDNSILPSNLITPKIGLIGHPVEKIPTTPITFTDNGIEFKIENGAVYKKDWFDADGGEYRIVFKEVGEINDVLKQNEFLENVKIQKLDWIKIK